MVYLPGQKFPEGIDYAYHRLMVDNLLVDFGYFKPGEVIEKKLAEMIPVEEKVPMQTASPAPMAIRPSVPAVAKIARFCKKFNSPITLPPNTGIYWASTLLSDSRNT